MIFVSLIWSGEALAATCKAKTFNIKLSQRVVMKAANFQALASQGTLVFIQGPEASYKSSTELIENFCRHGFSVYAFDLKGKKLKEADYLGATQKIAMRIKRTQPHLPILVYGWSKGANTAAHYAFQNRKLVKRLIFENPRFTSKALDYLSSYPGTKTRIFACSQKNLPRRALLLVPANSMKCTRHLTNNPGAIDPLVEFVESDFAGVNADTWFWKKNLI
ncbi:MAG: alpha/beta hydrolase [Oligoflexia bacterium]|nr:alpha/beta hydrolase [Oligoflexia bacterium]